MESHKPLRIVLIEDSLTDRILIEAALRGGLDVNWSVEHFDRLSTGIEYLLHHAADVAIVDLTLPDSMGMQTFERVHSEVSGVPVVVLTGVADEALAIEAVRAGAEDYLVKDAISAAVLGRAIRFAVERSRRREAERRLRETEHEFDAARRIQAHLLPEKPPELPGLDIAGYCHPAAATGGDYFDFIPMRDGHWGIVVADVSSHGFAPSLIMAGVRRVLRTLAAGTGALADIMRAANHAICEDTVEEQFVTLFFGRLEPVSRRLEYSGAGHSGLILGADGAASELRSTGFPLGLLDYTDFPVNNSVTLYPGETLVVMTDGYQEARNAERRFFGKDTVIHVLAKHRHRPACEMIALLNEAVIEFCRPLVPEDDQTIVVVKAESP